MQIGIWIHFHSAVTMLAVVALLFAAASAQYVLNVPAFSDLGFV